MGGEGEKVKEKDDELQTERGVYRGGKVHCKGSQGGKENMVLTMIRY